MGLTAEKLKEIKDQGDIQVINDTYSDRVYRHFAMLVRVRPKPAYQQNLDKDLKTGDTSNYQMFCSKVLDHSWKIENQILTQRLDTYKKLSGYVEISSEERKRMQDREKALKKQRQLAA